MKSPVLAGSTGAAAAAPALAMTVYESEMDAYHRSERNAGLAAPSAYCWIDSM